MLTQISKKRTFAIFTYITILMSLPRKSCEAVMRALRAQTAALMSVIGPFVYDPLVSWGRGRPVESGERTNEQALQHLQHIRQRLNGMVSWLWFKSSPH